jgi:hypothetical protein
LKKSSDLFGKRGDRWYNTLLIRHDWNYEEETSRVIQRKTQSASYWQAFSLTPPDIDFLHGLLLDAEKPLTTRQLAEALVAERCRREDSAARAELSRGTIYQPKKQFALNEKVIFPLFDYRLGEVVDIRPGENPEYGEFDVITVDFGPDRRKRSFAARLSAPHKLNLDGPDLLIAGDIAAPEQLMTTVAHQVPAILAAQLAQRPEFARFEDRWLLSDLLAGVHVGHLNIAEALIEVRTAPADTASLLRELDLPKEISSEIVAFSLQSALAADDRFDQVGAGDTRRWFLRRLEPLEALEMPAALRYVPIPLNRQSLPSSLAQLEWELDDEWSEEDPDEVSSARAALPTTTLLLTYPHLVSGTLPLNRHSRALFPRGHGERTMVALIDGRWGQRFSAWVVHGGRYIAGLRSWFEGHKLPAGAYITLERQQNSEEIAVDFRPKRMRREWTRWAQVVDGRRLDVQVRKQEVACEYDELVIIGDDQPDEMRKLRVTPAYAEAPLADLVYQIVLDLAGLSQTGSVHAKTIYSTVNVVRRCPPGPIFEVLATDARLQSAGDHLYRLTV